VTPSRIWALRAWILAITVAGLVGTFVSVGPLATAIWQAPMLAAVTVIIATALCLVASIVVIVVGWRRRLAEITIYGTALACASVLPMVHGITMPGVLYPDNSAVAISAFLAVPCALAVAAPALAPHLRVSNAIARQWRVWTVAWLAIGTLAAAALLIWPTALPAPTGGSALAVGVTALAVAGMITLALRQLKLHRIGGRAASIGAATGFAYLGFSTLVWLGAAPYSPGWWLAHVADAFGVLGATVGLWKAHANDRDLVATLAPVVNRDPLVALELGLTPVVHAFIAALATKDQVTRDHVVRVAELAMRSGVRAGLPPDRLRQLGLAALLHDVGKLTTPIDVLTKPGALTDDEFAVMKAHTVHGEQLMNQSPILAPAARFVRWHHERVDGTGYPDGLTQAEIPVEVALISVCDAWDAMTSTRPYRDGMPIDRAMAILQEHSGTQWDHAAVAWVLDEIAVTGGVAACTFDGVGRNPATVAEADLDLDCVCLDALPREFALR
jgi:HD domain